jgi:thiamine-monophosphate kinase
MRRRARASGEFDLIARVEKRTRLPRSDVLLGIGDDAAALRPPAGQCLVACVDALIEGVHFPRATAPADVGWKALAVNLSDLAAMGAMPRWATLSLTLPRSDPAWLDGFLRGWQRLARRHRVALVGGDTTRGPRAIAVQVLGSAPWRKLLRRSGARVGDSIWVSGTLGDAAAGLALVRRRLRGVNAADARFLRGRLDRPEPRVALGVGLRGRAHACIDVSDGLAQDLGHILVAAGVGATIDAECLPVSPALQRAVPDARRLLAHALNGGDDYELCFTAARARDDRIVALGRALGLRLTRIGRVTAARGLLLRTSSGRHVEYAARGYAHFR